METVRVDLNDRSYDILIGENLLSRAGELIAPVLAQPRVVIITDTNVAQLHLATLVGALAKSGINNTVITIAAGEASKSFATYERVMDQLLAENPERKTTIIAFGGGVIGDLAGFAASTLLRGVPFIQIPTTLLAQVDSSVGGKTGINCRHGKNLIGCFYQPRMVLADIDVLSTLPKRQMLAGYAEVVKYGLIDDPEFFTWLEENGKRVLAGDASAITHAVSASCHHKANIVKQDERESGKRALLNLGHTFGHALEAETGFGDKLLHGEAVAIGMIQAFQLSAAKGLCPLADVDRLIAHCQATGLPYRAKDISNTWNIDALIRHFAQDKKVADGKLTFILARGIGQSFISRDVHREELVKLLEATT
ncbi:MAG: 3-dehydroquinate synthase [Alphaproteobacteria bacterium]|nr:3-dehydroquinate synthase [Alphaproteobacteria bacterium]